MKLLSKFLIFSLIFAYGINKNFVLAAKKNHFSKIFLLWDNRTIALDFKAHPELIEKVPQYKVLIADNNLLLPQENLLSLPGVFPMETSFKNKISQENLRNFLESEINFEIKDQKPVEITIENEQVKFSRFPESGYFVSMENLVNLLDFALENEIKYVHVPAKKIYSSIVSDSQLSEQGITEILSIGKSNFTGSSWQRKQNILAAVKKFNGQIIPAKGRFSFNKILESVNPEDGFVPELVIKGNSVSKELGGGVCQVSTTAFRAIFNGGLPVRTRKSHSYAVPYYQPVGLDAAIYLGGSDLQFTNDTGSSILMKSFVKDDDVFFVFYGKSDGRSVEISGPFIDNYSPAPRKIKYVATRNLPAGKLELVSHAYAGFDTNWERKVFYGNGKLKEKTNLFSSYRPWFAQYKVGEKKIRRKIIRKKKYSDGYKWLIR
jgi:vancomycin resistance protein YoaR